MQVLPVRFRPLKWLWFGSGRPGTAADPVLSARTAELTRRAELAVELAERAERPAEPFVHGNADALACELYAQAICWTLAAHRSHHGDVATEIALAPLWERTNAELLTSAAGSSEEREQLRAAVSGKSFADFAELKRVEQVDLARRLASLAVALLAPLRGARQQRARQTRGRLIRFGGLAVAFTVLALAVLQTLDWNEQRRDLARRARWTTSSIFAVGGCPSPAQTCPEGPSYFFHTLQEKNASITFDLRSRKGVSSVIIDNRLDCCHERAVPLVVEVSDDQKTWKEVARHKETFTRWRAKFPRVRARYVKIHAVGDASILHLSRVRILP